MLISVLGVLLFQVFQVSLQSVVPTLGSITISEPVNDHSSALQQAIVLSPVSKDFSLDSTYIPEDLVYITDSKQLRAEAAAWLKLLLDDATANGIELHVLSAYRSYNQQIGLFAGYASRYGIDEANRFSARAGHSEHQLGTTVDLGYLNKTDFTSEFGDTQAGIWLENNAYRYGFVLSYPEGYEEVTGYKYEPWHYRYVGKDTSQRIHESGKISFLWLQDNWVE